VRELTGLAVNAIAGAGPQSMLTTDWNPLVRAQFRVGSPPAAALAFAAVRSRLQHSLRVGAGLQHSMVDADRAQRHILFVLRRAPRSRHITNEEVSERHIEHLP
jgi:hypothetical protein